MGSADVERGRRYYESFDIIRLLMMACIVIAYFGLPTEAANFVTPMFHFATGVMFTIYGYLVLRSDQELGVNVRRLLKAFALCAVVYFVMAEVHLYILTGDPLGWIGKRAIFNLLVLNYWTPDMGASIWMLQATLYATAFFCLVRVWERWDRAMCIVLFIIAIVFGELSSVIGFNFLGYSYISANFFTRAMPYMLLGRLMHKKRRKLAKLKRKMIVPTVFVIGATLSMVEYLTLYHFGLLAYQNHFVGFIPMAWAVVTWGISHPHIGSKDELMTQIMPYVYKIVYYVFNPIGVVLLSIFSMTVDSGGFGAVGLITLGLSLLIAFSITLLGSGAFMKWRKLNEKRMRHRYRRM